MEYFNVLGESEIAGMNKMESMLQTSNHTRINCKGAIFSLQVFCLGKQIFQNWTLPGSFLSKTIRRSLQCQDGQRPSRVAEIKKLTPWVFYFGWKRWIMLPIYEPNNYLETTLRKHLEILSHSSLIIPKIPPIS